MHPSNWAGLSQPVEQRLGDRRRERLQVFKETVFKALSSDDGRGDPGNRLYSIAEIKYEFSSELALP